MSLKKFFDAKKEEAKKDLSILKADVNKLKTKAGAEADALKAKIAKNASKVANDILYVELAPLRIPMNILLKKKGIKDYDSKNIESVARKFYETFVEPVTEKTNFEYASNFDTFVDEQITKYGIKEPKSASEIAYHVDEATTQAMGMSTPEVKDKENQAGKTTGALVGTALGAAGIPIPPAVTSAIGGAVQGIVRGIINFFKAKKNNKDVKQALDVATKDLQAKTTPETMPTEEAPKHDMKPLLYIVGAIVVIGIAYFLIKKK